MPTHLTEGMPAPAFTGNDQDGTQVSLDFKGKKLVLFFYPEDDTPTCTIQACNLRDNYGLLNIYLTPSTSLICKKKRPFQEEGPLINCTA